MPLLDGDLGQSAFSAEDGTLGPQEKFGLIDGIAGIGLALLAAISNVGPNWDRIFMVDIAPVEQP